MNAKITTSEQLPKNSLSQLNMYLHRLVILAKEFDYIIVDGREFAKKFQEITRINDPTSARTIIRYFSGKGYLSIRDGMVNISKLRAFDFESIKKELESQKEESAFIKEEGN